MSGTARQRALASAVADGFGNDGVTSTVTANVNTSRTAHVSYLEGPHAGTPDESLVNGTRTVPSAAFVTERRFV